MTPSNMTRRDMLAKGAAVGAGAAFAAAPAAATENTEDTFQYEVQRTEEEWKSMLSVDEYDILRNGGTEWPGSSPFWEDYQPAEFHCRGCDLHVYSSEWRVELDKGWIFFAHSQPNAILTDIDKSANYSMTRDVKRTLIEAHCRRCGSHMGHILIVDKQLVHCINGASLVFKPHAA